jgi:hypothetical protein
MGQVERAGDRLVNQLVELRIELAVLHANLKWSIFGVIACLIGVIGAILVQGG